LEASACGTPIVAFAAGGIPEIVRTDCNGILAPVGDPVALRSGISKLLLDPRLARTLGDNGRELAVREFALSNQASRYREIYTKMISQA
jgi:glycosyltransferase involved in cell wall biosynthesis